MNGLIDVLELSKFYCEYPMQAELAYAGVDNLVGRPIAGYHPEARDVCLLTLRAAKALCLAQNHFMAKHQVSIFIYDAYRPRRAVNDFLTWSTMPPANTFELEQKEKYYPTLEKKNLFSAGYLSEDSGHCYGNTVDFVLIDSRTQQELPMGAMFDFMDDISHWTATIEQIGVEAYRHREILMNTMVTFGFEPYVNEFWHFSHGGVAGREFKEPLDIEITPELRGLGVSAILLNDAP